MFYFSNNTLPIDYKVEIEIKKTRVNINENEISINEISDYILTVNNKSISIQNEDVNIEKATCIAPDYDYNYRWNIETLNGIDIFDELGIWYGCVSQNSQQIRKPVLIIEGFDPQNTRWLRCEDMNDNAVSTANHLYHTANQKNLADSLRLHGYDIIILNFKDGTGDLVENALVAVDAIEWINANKVTDNELVIIGPSMGGVIARFALAYMEENNLEHQTKLYLSFDAPHQGANVCLGFQHIANFAANTSNLISLGFWDKIVDLRDEVLDPPATKQLCLYHQTGTAGTNAYPNPVHTAFYEQMENLNSPHNGYPVKCRKIAIANGSGFGSNQTGIANGQNLFSTFIVTPIIPFLGGFSVYLRYSALPNYTFKFISQAAVFYLPALPCPWNIPLPINLNAIGINTSYAFDNVPAGTQTFHRDFNNLAAPYGITTINDQNFDAFVPVRSALDLNVTDWRYDLYSNNANNIVGAFHYYFPNRNLTPFDEVFCNSFNDPHVINSLDAFSGPWSQNEISPYHLKLQNDLVNYNTRYEAKRSITLGRNIDAQQLPGDYKVAYSANLELVAGMEINFETGFDSNNGSLETFLQNPTCNGKMIEAGIDENEQSQIWNDKPHTILQLILDSEVNDIAIYPNPTDNLFTLEINNFKENYVLEICDMLGNVIINNVINESKIEINTLDWAKGIYICKIISNGKTITQKIIVQ